MAEAAAHAGFSCEAPIAISECEVAIADELTREWTGAMEAPALASSESEDEWQVVEDGDAASPPALRAEGIGAIDQSLAPLRRHRLELVQPLAKLTLLLGRKVSVAL